MAIMAERLGKILHLSELNVRTKLVRLIIFLLTLMTLMVLYTTVTLYRQKNQGLVVNIAGRQRMLTQKYTKEFFLSLHQQGTLRDTTLAAMEKTGRLFDVSLKALTSGGQTFLDLGMSRPIQIPPASNRAIAAQLSTVRTLWQTLTTAVRNATQNEPSAKELAAINGSSVKTLAAMNKAVGMMANRADAMVRWLQIIEVAMWLFALGCSWIISTLLVDNLTTPLASMVQTAQRVADGDLRNRPIPRYSHDEIGSLAGHLEKMRKRLNDLIHGIQRSARQASHSSQQVAIISREIADTSAEEEKRSHEVMEAITSLQAVSEHVGDTIVQARDTVRQAEDEAETGIKVVRENIELLTKAVDSVHATAREIESLDKASDKIHIIIESIQEIADQTNLLALNATIEAARAGEAGKGFAVVANEIKELAKQTAEATDEITHLINLLTEQVSKAVSSMQQVVGEVNNSQQMSEHTVGAFSNMRASVEQSTASTDQIEEYNRQQVEQLSLLQEKLRELFSVLASSSEKSESVALVSEDISSVARQLDNRLEIFKVDPVADPIRQPGEKRQHPRANNRLRMELETRDGKKITAVSNDISAQGLNLRCDHELEPGETVRAMVHIPSNGQDPSTDRLALNVTLTRRSHDGHHYNYGARLSLANPKDEEKLKQLFAYFKSPYRFKS